PAADRRRRLLVFRGLRFAGFLGAGEGGGAQLGAGRAAAQLLARARAVSGTEDVAKVRLVLERVRVLLGVTGGAGARRRLGVNGQRLLQALLGDVLRARAVADLA